MESVGIRELKAHLSHHLRRVRAGVRLAVTERGRTIATITPSEALADTDWARQLVADGHAQWNGGKPSGAKLPSRAGKPTASSVVLDDRR